MTIARVADALTCELCYGTFDIDGISLQTPAWCVPDLSLFWSSPGKRGSDLQVADDDAAEAHARRSRISAVQLPFWIVGKVDQAGVVYGDPYDGIATNRRYLTTNLLATPGTAGGTRTATFTPPGLSALAGEVHVVRLAGKLLPGAIWRGTIDLELIDDSLYI